MSLTDRINENLARRHDTPDDTRFADVLAEVDDYGNTNRIETEWGIPGWISSMADFEDMLRQAQNHGASRRTLSVLVSNAIEAAALYLDETTEAVIERLTVMHDRKQADYGADDDPYANVRASEDWDIPGWVGALVRGGDKVYRLRKAANRILSGGDDGLVNESVEDSLIDLAVYCVIAVVLWDEVDGPPPQRAEPAPLTRDGARLWHVPDTEVGFA